MNSLISFNNKFISLKPSEIAELIIKSKYTKGLEIYLDFFNELEKDYLARLVFEIKKNNLILQIHGEIELDFDKQLKYMKELESYSDYLGYPIIVTFHSILNEDQETSIRKTTDYIENLSAKVDNNKIIISIENLNDMYGIDRLEKEKIKTIILNNENVYFTYDIGHELIDFSFNTNLDNYMIEEIRNVHIHSFDLSKRDHMPIYKNDKYWNEVIKAITYLKTINYKYNIVFEYDLDRCYGNTIKEKVEDYLKSIDLISEHFY